MEFTKSDRRTSYAPIYTSPEGYEICKGSASGWYFRDHTGFVGADKLSTLREAKEEANDWYSQFGGRS